ncbi:hypothetical protein [Pseudooceanicola sp.]|uniref:hypothetical protein n=1 Tax=Pseudooceanicola sp. TaxID=1914328 RepID=UPI0040594132
MTFPTTIMTGVTIADADLDGLQAAQVNPYGKLLPRQIAANEFRAVEGNLAINDTMRSQHFAGIVDNANPATCIGTFDNYSASDKGLRLVYATGALDERKIKLQPQFDLNHADLGDDDANLLIYMWLTEKAAAISGTHAIAGYGVATSEFAQWYFDYIVGTGYRFRCMGTPYTAQAQITFGELADDTPALLAAHLYPDAVDPTTFKCDAYLNGVLHQTASAKPDYPFNDPSGATWAGNPAFPILGRRSGYTTGHDVVVHGIGLARITEHDDVAAFLAAEYALNAAALA